MQRFTVRLETFVVILILVFVAAGVFASMILEIGVPPGGIWSIFASIVGAIAGALIAGWVGIVTAIRIEREREERQRRALAFSLASELLAVDAMLTAALELPLPDCNKLLSERLVPRTVAYNACLPQIGMFGAVVLRIDRAYGSIDQLSWKISLNPTDSHRNYIGHVRDAVASALDTLMRLTGASITTQEMRERGTDL